MPEFEGLSNVSTDRPVKYPEVGHERLRETVNNINLRKQQKHRTSGQPLRIFKFPFDNLFLHYSFDIIVER
jgi:hypothetical protein